jgi:hypothetical protein
MPSPNYVTVSQLKAYKVGGELLDLSMFTDDELSAAIIEAEELIESIVGDWFYAKTVTEYIDGNGLYDLFFPPWIKAPCISLTSVQLVDYDGTTVLESLVENEDYKRYEYYIRMTGQSGDSAARHIASMSGRFPRGEKNIKVVGSFGNLPTPAAIVRATKILSTEQLLPGSNSLTPRDVAQASWPDFTVTYKGDGAVAGSPTTGFAEVDRLIQNHINYSSMFIAEPDERSFSSESTFRM